MDPHQAKRNTQKFGRQDLVLQYESEQAIHTAVYFD
jgi:hypothetical protein